MRLRFIAAMLAGLVLVLPGGAAQAAPLKDPAAVIPSTAIGYYELRQPGPLAKELASLLEGSMLGNLPDSMVKFRKQMAERGGSRGDGEWMAVFAALGAPELARELGRIQGVAAAITGIDVEAGVPKFIVVVLPGDSNLPHFAARMFLTAYSHGDSSFDGMKRTWSTNAFEPVEECEGVKIYRLVSRTYEEEAGKPPVKKSERIDPAIPAVAMTPEMILVGSVDVVKDAIGLAAGKSTKQSLAQSAAFQKVRNELGNEPGLFAYAEMSKSIKVFDNMPLPPRERDQVKAILGLVNLNAFTDAASSFTLSDGQLRARYQIGLNPAQRSPVLDFVPSARVPAELLHYSFKDAMLFAALSNDDAERRLESVVKFIDVIAPQPLSREIAEMEKALGMKLGQDILAKVRGASVCIAGPERLLDKKFKGEPAMAICVLAADEATAKNFAAETFPRILGVMRDQPALKPAESRVGGYTIRTYEDIRLSYAQHGSVLVFSPHPDLIAEILTNGTKQDGFVAAQNLGPRMKDYADASVLVSFKPFGMASMFFALSQAAAAEFKRLEQELKPIDKARPEPKPVNDIPKGADDEAKMMEQFMKLVKAEEPLLIGITKKPEKLLLDATYPGLKKWVPQAIDLFVNADVIGKAAPPRFEPAPPPPPKPFNDVPAKP